MQCDTESRLEKVTVLKARESRKKGIGAAVGRHCGDGGKQWRVLSSSAPWTAVTGEKGHPEGLSRARVLFDNVVCVMLCTLRDKRFAARGIQVALVADNGK